MSYVAISFPVTKGTPDSQKTESLKAARKFAKDLGLVPGKDIEVLLIRESTYGVVLPSDVDNEVIMSAKKFGGKVAPFTESDSQAKKSLKEGTWIKLPKAVAGFRHEMHGTTSRNPMEGKVLPGDYFILGIQESNGGAYATLGRVDTLAEIGREGKGRYTYNVDLDILAQTVVKETKTESKTESTKQVAKNESAHDRSNEILDMLLANDPYVIRQDRAAKAKEESQIQENDKEPSFEDMISMSMEAMVGDTKPVVESESEKAEETSEETPAEDNVTSEDATASEDSSETTEDSTSEDDKEESEDLDPETFVEAREILNALEAKGLDVDTMSEEELTSFISQLMEDESKEESDEDKTEKSDDSTDTDKEVEETKAEEAKAESDDAFEVS